MSAPYHIRDAEHLGQHRLRLTFADGQTGEVNLAFKFENELGPVFEPLRDLEYFARVEVDNELGTVVWPNGADFAPDVLHELARETDIAEPSTRY